MNTTFTVITSPIITIFLTLLTALHFPHYQPMVFFPRTHCQHYKFVVVFTLIYAYINAYSYAAAAQTTVARRDDQPSHNPEMLGSANHEHQGLGSVVFLCSAFITHILYMNAIKAATFSCVDTLLPLFSPKVKYVCSIGKSCHIISVKITFTRDYLANITQNVKNSQAKLIN